MPAPIEVLALLFRKSALIECESLRATVPRQFEPNDRVDSLRPIARTPRLDDARVRLQFNVAARDHAAEARERPARRRDDLGRRPAVDLGELPGIGQCLVGTLGT